MHIRPIGLHTFLTSPLSVCWLLASIAWTVVPTTIVLPLNAQLCRGTMHL